MPIVKNISPKGDLELVLHQVDSEPDEDGHTTVLSHQRVLFVNHGDTVEVSQREAKLLDGFNWEIQKPKKTPTKKLADGGVVTPDGVETVVGENGPESIIPAALLGDVTEHTEEASA